MQINSPHLGRAAQTPYIWSRSLSCGGNWSENRFQFSAPTWFLNPCSICRRRTYTFIRLYYRKINRSIEINCMKRIFFLPAYLLEHILEIFSGSDPGCNSVAEEDEILDDSPWVYRNHLTHTSERRVLFFIVSYAPQRSTPGKVGTNITNWVIVHHFRKKVYL